jgi:phosphohistidine phosphatase
MQRLVLFRHAKAERAAPSGEDFDRALTDRGLADARLIGAALKAAGVKPDLALVSSAVRTRQTWEAAQTVLAGGETRLDKALFNANSGQLRRAVEQGAGDAGAVVLVGHNPAIHQLGVDLLVEGGASGAVLDRVKGKFPTATALLIDFDLADRPSYGGLFLAKDHGGGGED